MRRRTIYFDYFVISEGFCFLKVKWSWNRKKNAIICHGKCLNNYPNHHNFRQLQIITHSRFLSNWVSSKKQRKKCLIKSFYGTMDLFIDCILLHVCMCVFDCDNTECVPFNHWNYYTLLQIAALRSSHYLYLQIYIKFALSILTTHFRFVNRTQYQHILWYYKYVAMAIKHNNINLCINMHRILAFSLWFGCSFCLIAFFSLLAKMMILCAHFLLYREWAIWLKIIFCHLIQFNLHTPHTMFHVFSGRSNSIIW